MTDLRKVSSEELANHDCHLSPEDGCDCVNAEVVDDFTFEPVKDVIPVITDQEARLWADPPRHPVYESEREKERREWRNEQEEGKRDRDAGQVW